MMGLEFLHFAREYLRAFLGMAEAWGNTGMPGGWVAGHVTFARKFSVHIAPSVRLTKPKSLRSAKLNASSPAP
jgi:hypothetical protein